MWIASQDGQEVARAQTQDQLTSELRVRNPAPQGFYSYVRINPVEGERAEYTGEVSSFPPDTHRRSAEFDQRPEWYRESYYEPYVNGKPKWYVPPATRGEWAAVLYRVVNTKPGRKDPAVKEWVARSSDGTNRSVHTLRAEAARKVKGRWIYGPGILDLEHELRLYVDHWPLRYVYHVADEAKLFPPQS